MARRVAPALASQLGTRATVRVTACKSQIGSGALPLAALPSWALRIRRTDRTGARALQQLAGAFRTLPKPVVGRLHADALWFDLRCLEDERGFVSQLDKLVFD
jgi:L-seryl-tRNA(Ser) seleniumtransferase